VSYRLEPGRSIASEVRRIGERQVAQALAALQGVGMRHDDKATHRARRHVKKVRALLRLFHPSLAHSHRVVNRRLRTVSRLLAPIADGEAVVDTFARIERTYRHRLPRSTFAAVRAGLGQLESHAARKAQFERALETAARVLRIEQHHARVWRLTESGFRAVGPGLERSVRRTRRAMAAVLEHPSEDHYHAWRRRVKDLWLQTRLIQARCGGRLRREEARLERLDGRLGEYHDCVLLAEVLTAEPLISRQQTARCLRLIRHHQKELRRQIHSLARKMFSETPRAFVRRARHCWRVAEPSRRVRTAKATWRPAA
jgi:CHAD domain-containing protein